MHLSNVVKNPSFQKQMHVPASCYYQWYMTLKKTAFAFKNTRGFGYA